MDGFRNRSGRLTNSGVGYLQGENFPIPRILMLFRKSFGGHLRGYEMVRMSSTTLIQTATSTFRIRTLTLDEIRVLTVKHWLTNKNNEYNTTEKILVHIHINSWPYSKETNLKWMIFLRIHYSRHNLRKKCPQKKNGYNIRVSKTFVIIFYILDSYRSPRSPALLS